MENINSVLEILKRKSNGFKGDYFIPRLWNCTGFSNYTTVPGRDGEICLNPYEFMIHCIENHILSKANSSKKSYLLPLDEETPLENSVIYSMLPRTFTAWNHYGDNLSNGTFLKAVCLLPYLLKMNVNIIYLLPVFQYSNSYKKGETGSPYSIRNIYNLDQNLHDHLLGENSKSMIETEFKAFMEACHLCGIRVMVDFVFRTVARDSDLIVEHPDWFYWIKLQYSKTFCAPRVDTLKKPTVPNEKVIPDLYNCKSINSYLSQFTLPPNELDHKKWKQVLEKHKNKGTNILELIEEEFEITTAPGFSDVINDSQPPWSDATYLKFYYDSHSMAKQYVPKGQAPYILNDIAKLNIFRGEARNTTLWDYTVNVIPYYQENFGIDGARIDMGHALPTDLNKEIIRKAKQNNKHFLLWSEEFDIKNSPKAKSDGFDFLTGSLWYEYKNIDKPGFYKKVVGSLISSAMPAAGALESPDTPRAAYNYKGKDNIEMMILLNYFMPNIVPMINNGMELMELQPMNLGLDNSEEGRFVLDKTDPMYGKLAFFDNYKFHWTDENSSILPHILEKASLLRNTFSEVIGRKENFVYQPELEKRNKILFLCYYCKTSKKNVFLLANRSRESRAKVRLDNILPEILCGMKEVKVAYNNGKQYRENLSIDKQLLLLPKEVIIGFLH